MGEGGVEVALKGGNCVMPRMGRRSDRPYRWSMGKAPLADVANREKMMPRSYITRDGFGITAAARRYLSPLIQGEAYPPYRGGLPAYGALKLLPVKKKLPAR